MNAHRPPLKGFEKLLVRPGQKGLEGERLDLVKERRPPNRVEVRRNFIQQ